ncbi:MULTISPECIES: RidA family protein [unclassified Mesorhizobium]|uniref:RidA family protein n=1 Tax=unclassified Mesorhizobium TaxID=325217 RepID=UPI001FEF6A27|nr:MULTISPECIES: RidA family protein [unclassified Mesorhizobium]
MSSGIVRHSENNRMSLAVEAGGFVFLAGLTAVETRGATVAAQTKEILQRIDHHLAEADSSKANLVSAQIWLTDSATFNEFNTVWEEWVADVGKPVRACVESRLADPALNVEIMVTAWR